MEHLPNLAEVRGELEERRHLDEIRFHATSEEDPRALARRKCVQQRRFTERTWHRVRLEYDLERREEFPVYGFANRVAVQFRELQL